MVLLLWRYFCLRSVGGMLGMDTVWVYQTDISDHIHCNKLYWSKYELNLQKVQYIKNIKKKEVEKERT